jgi:hypothetical protein
MFRSAPRVTNSVAGNEGVKRKITFSLWSRIISVTATPSPNSSFWLIIKTSRKRYPATTVDSNNYQTRELLFNWWFTNFHQDCFDYIDNDDDDYYIALTAYAPTLCSPNSDRSAHTVDDDREFGRYSKKSPSFTTIYDCSGWKTRLRRVPTRQVIAARRRPAP